MALIRTLIPFSPDRHLGAAYNAEMQALPEDGWACFLDHDAALTTPHWYRQLQEAIACRPDGTFTAVTNRIASSWQRAPEAEGVGDDMPRHRAIGEARLARRTLLDITCTKGYGGVLQLVSKAAWRDAGGYFPGAMFCVDHSLFFGLKAAGRRVYVIEGLYLYHARASSSARRPITEPKVPNCPCRGPEEMPTERIALL